MNVQISGERKKRLRANWGAELKGGKYAAQFESCRKEGWAI